MDDAGYMDLALRESEEALARGDRPVGAVIVKDGVVLCSGQNQRQVRAIADNVEEALRAVKIRPAHVEGYDRSEWVLMDFFTFIVHVFTPQTRDFYSLERLWGDAERIDVSDEPPAKHA